MAKRKRVLFVPTRETWEAALSFKGMAAKFALAAYYKLPMHWQLRIERDDFIMEGVYFLAERLTKWNKTKGSQSTLAFATLHNYYKSQLDTLLCARRASEVVSMEDVVQGIPDVHSTSRIVEKGVEYLHKNASYELLCLLDEAFFTPHEGFRLETKTPTFKRLRSEFQTLAKTYNVSIDDYRNAIAIHHERISEIPFHRFGF